MHTDSVFNSSSVGLREIIFQEIFNIMIDLGGHAQIRRNYHVLVFSRNAIERQLKIY